MGFKGIYKDKSSATKIGILFLLIFVSVILHTLVGSAIVLFFSDFGLSQDLSNQVAVNYLKLLQLFSAVGLFVAPTLLYAYLTDFDYKLLLNFKRQSAFLVIVIMMLITPFIGWLLEMNMSIPFPDWILRLGNDSEKIVESFLKMNHLGDLLFNLLVIAIVPAIGEELLFRGYLQQSFSKWLSNPHVAIIVTAVLFSSIHLHFQGFFPRFILGVLLGYLFYWSGSLWLPILAHFLNNAQAVIFSYPTFKVDSGAYSVLSDVEVDPMMALFSFASVVVLLFMFYKTVSIKKD
jgi:membrane protease YdiL (CAAX protease family)